MILDSLENSKRIECIHPLFKQAFDYVKSTDFSKMEDGKYEIADAGFTVSIASLFGKEKSIRHLFPGRRARPGYRPREYPEGGYQDPGPIVSNTLFVPQE